MLRVWLRTGTSQASPQRKAGKTELCNMYISGLKHLEVPHKSTDSTSTGPAATTGSCQRTSTATKPVIDKRYAF